MNSDNLKSVIKLIVFAIVILGGYYATQVTPVEIKRMEATAKNFETVDSYNFSGKASLEEARSGFYDIQLEGRKVDGKVAGDFNLETEISTSNQTIKGEFISEGSDLYLNFDEDGLPIALESFFMDNYNTPIEEVRNNWVLLPTNQKFNIEFLNKKVEALPNDEKLNEKEVFHYKTPIKVNSLFESEIPTELWIGQEDLNVYRLKTDQSFELSKNINFKDPFVDFPAGISPTLKTEFNFSNFENSEEITLPEDYLEL